MAPGHLGNRALGGGSPKSPGQSLANAFEERTFVAVRFGSRPCENARAPFEGVIFSHVDAVSGDLSHRIRLLATPRGERNQFSHGLGHEATVGGLGSIDGR